MKKKSLKSALKFWQEIALAVSIGLLLIEVCKWVMRSQTMGGAEIFLVVWFLPLFICLIGQMFWKNKTLAITLSVFLGLSSFIVLLMALWGISNSPSYRTESIAMFVVGVVSVITVITMPRKYNSNISSGILVKPIPIIPNRKYNAKMK